MANSIIGIERLDRRRRDADDVAQPAPLEEGDDDAVGRADRQQVHDHGLERHEHERNTTISSRNDSVSTAPKKHGRRAAR